MRSDHDHRGGRDHESPAVCRGQTTAHFVFHSPQVQLSSANARVFYFVSLGPSLCAVIVPDNQLSLAIGREGQNVRLAHRLTGWKIDIKSVSQMENEEASKTANYEYNEEVQDEEERPVDSDEIQEEIEEEMNQQAIDEEDMAQEEVEEETSEEV